MDEMFTVGKIVNTHGVKGEVKVMPSTEDPRRFEKLKAIYVVQKKGMTTYEIAEIEGVDHQRISKSILAAKKKIKKILPES